MLDAVKLQFEGAQGLNKALERREDCGETAAAQAADAWVGERVTGIVHAVRCVMY
jgi:hypothetical protein